MAPRPGNRQRFPTMANQRVSIKAQVNTGSVNHRTRINRRGAARVSHASADCDHIVEPTMRMFDAIRLPVRFARHDGLVNRFGYAGPIGVDNLLYDRQDGKAAAEAGMIQAEQISILGITVEQICSQMPAEEGHLLGEGGR